MVETKWDYKWPIDEWGNRKSVRDFTNIEQVRYQVYMARMECTVDKTRHIKEEIFYLNNWYSYFSLLARAGEFDPESLKYLSLEIGRLYKERVGWH